MMTREPGENSRFELSGKLLARCGEDEGESDMHAIVRCNWRDDYCRNLENKFCVLFCCKWWLEIIVVYFIVCFDDGKFFILICNNLYIYM